MALIEVDLYMGLLFNKKSLSIFAYFFPIRKPILGLLMISPPAQALYRCQESHKTQP